MFVEKKHILNFPPPKEMAQLAFLRSKFLVKRRHSLELLNERTSKLSSPLSGDVHSSPVSQ